MTSHIKGIGCDKWYAEQRRQRICGCGRIAIGLTKHGLPVCAKHDDSVTKAVRPLQPILPCPGPHKEK